MEVCSKVAAPVVDVGTAARPHRVACHLYA